MAATSGWTPSRDRAPLSISPFPDPSNRSSNFMSTRPSANMIKILLVDDDPGDVRLTVEALKQTKMHTNLNFARDGIEALAFLRRQGKFTAAPCPDIIFLDLNMPRMDGREVLGEIKQDPDLMLIPAGVWPKPWEA